MDHISRATFNDRSSISSENSKQTAIRKKYRECDEEGQSDQINRVETTFRWRTDDGPTLYADWVGTLVTTVA